MGYVVSSDEIKKAGAFDSHGMGDLEADFSDIIAKEDFDRVLEKSKLSISDVEYDYFRNELASIVGWSKHLDDIAIDLEPMVEPQLKPSQLCLREDNSEVCSADDVLSGADEVSMGYFVIGKMKWKN